MLEVIGWSGKLLGVDHALVCNPIRKLDVRYAVAEYLHIMSRSNQLDMLECYAPSYAKYADDNGKLNWAYGHRLWTNCQGADLLYAAIDLLKADPNTRQCCLSVWKPDDIIAGQTEKYVPCTMNWKFYLRDDALHMVVDIRSQDVWLGMPYDIFIATLVQRVVAGELGVSPGSYTHNVGSLHVYNRHFEQCQQALDTKRYVPKPLGWELEEGPTHLNAELAITLESLIRDGSIIDYDSAQTYGFDRLDRMHRGLISCIGHRWSVSLPCFSPALKETLERC